MSTFFDSPLRSQFGIVVVVAMAIAATAVGATFDLSTDHDGLTRRYRLFVPDGYDGSEALPVVVNMHGLTGNRFQQESTSEMNAVATKENFLVAYPDAISGDWMKGEDNIGFIDHMIGEVEASYQVDSSRVYATGMSQGGMMSFQLAAALPNRFAAIAPVGGVLMTEPLKTAPAYTSLPDRPLPIMHLHGTTDAVVPYAGGLSRWANINAFTGNREFASVESVLDIWASNNGCSGAISTTDLPNTSSTDGSRVAEIRRTDCATYTTSLGTEMPAEVVHLKIDGGGHTWPGGPSEPTLGTTNQDIEGSQVIWDFFSQHTLPFRESLDVCDFDGNGRCGVTDIDALTAAAVAGDNDSAFDLNGDLSVDRDDAARWLQLAATDNGFSQPYLAGDSNLDGSITAADLNSVALNWRQPTTKWSGGDFNTDGMVDASDLNSLALNWRESIAVAAAPVPEPRGGMMACIACCLALLGSRVRQVV